MAEPEGDPAAVSKSFGEHLNAFHQSLPPEQRALLEQVCALANDASSDGDVQGFATIELHSFSVGALPPPPPPPPSR